jgi:hypothetical protein
LVLSSKSVEMIISRIFKKLSSVILFLAINLLKIFNSKLNLSIVKVLKNLNKHLKRKSLLIQTESLIS